MWGAIGTLALKLFTGFDVNGLVQSVVSLQAAKVNAGTDASKIDADLVAREVNLAQRQLELQAMLTQNARWYSPRELMGYGVTFFVVKVLVWDKCLHLGVTDALDPNMWWVVTTAVVAYYGVNAVSDVMTKIRGR